MRVIQKWTKFLAVGCSHGTHISQEAREAVLQFQKRYKPEEVIHLGDAIDCTSLRAGAIKDSISGDHSADLADDFESGICFLKELSPTIYMMGNHENRLYALAQSSSAVISFAAEKGIEEIEKVAKKLHCRVFPYDIEKGIVVLGGTAFLHGFLHSENAVRDTIESVGRPVVMAHLHRAEIQRGRMLNSPYGICTGTLANIGAMAYARQRRATLRWGHGFVWGEYSPKGCVAWLATPTGGEWRLPV